MTAEELIAGVLEPLAVDRVFPDVAPEGTPVPYITYQAVGGMPINFVSGETPTKQPVRMQVNVWALGRIEASVLGAQVENALRDATELQVEVLTGRVATYDEATKRRGFMQDFQLFC